MQQIAREYHLCPQLIGLQKNNERCYPDGIHPCNEQCLAKTNRVKHNELINKVIGDQSMDNVNFVIKNKGRTETELSFIMVNRGEFVGYGFVKDDFDVKQLKDWTPHLIRTPRYREIDTYIVHYLQQHQLLNNITFYDQGLDYLPNEKSQIGLF